MRILFLKTKGLTIQIATIGIILVFVLFFSNNSYSQTIIPLNNDINQALDKYLDQRSSDFHTALKPYVFEINNAPINLDTIITSHHPTNNSLLNRKLFKEHLLEFHKQDLNLAISPLMDFERSSYNMHGQLFSQNTRGIWIEGNFGKNLYFKTTYTENQTVFPNYIDKYNRKYKMIIGETFIKIFKNDSSVYDYGSATGVISWHPIKQINIQCGNDKLFIGNGYRSLFLSDFASQYPYLKTTYTSKRIQYSYILTSFQNPGFYLINAPTDNKLQSYQTKTGSFAFASINLTSSLQVGLFESMIWENNDARSNKFNYGVLNPIIFTKSAYYGLNNTNNALIGLNLNYKLLNQTALYGQFIIDNLAFSVPDGRRIGYQMGFKSHDVFAIKNLYIQSEINSVNPYTYSSSSNEQSYTHNLMPLAHPLGANFYELVGIISYRYKNIYAKFKYNYSQVGLDTSLIQNEGQDLLKTVNTLTSNSRLLEGEKTTIQNIDISLQYIINPKTNFQLFIEYANRSLENQSTKENTSYLFFGLRTQLTNHYSDF